MEALATPDVLRTGEAQGMAAWLPWSLELLCTLHRRPFDAALMAREFPPPHDESVLVQAAQQLGFRTSALAVSVSGLAALPVPALLCVQGGYAMLLRADDSGATWLREGETQPA